MRKYPLNFEHQLGGGIEAISAEKKKDRPMANIHTRDIRRVIRKARSADRKNHSTSHLLDLRQI